MEFLKVQEIELPAAFDAHVHLRDGEMAQLVAPTVRKGGADTVYVMVCLETSKLDTIVLVYKLSYTSFSSHCCHAFKLSHFSCVVIAVHIQYLLLT